MIKQMAMEYIFISMAQGMKVHGKMICSMDKGRKLGLMAQFMRESIWQAKNMGKGFIAGMMVLDMVVNGTRTRLKVSALTPG
jgi:hypothetical protein